MKLERSLGENVDLEDFFGEVSARLIRARSLANLAQNTYSEHFSCVELRESHALQTADQLGALIDVTASEVSAIISLVGPRFSALIEPKSSVGKHVDIQRRRKWAEALAAYREADLIEPEADQAPAIEALNRLSTTPAPSLRALHEKMTILVSNEYLNSDEAIDSVMGDIETLTRRYEIASDDVATTDRPDPRADWESAVAHYHKISAVAEAHPLATTSHDDPGFGKVAADYGAVSTHQFQAFDRVVQLPAPDYLAVADKLDVAASMQDEHDHVLEGVKFAAADIRRLCGEA